MTALVQSLKGAANAAIALLYPELCQVCKESRATLADGFVCDKCQAQINWIEPPFCQRCGLVFQGDISTAFECANCRDMDYAFSSARSAVHADGPVLDAIHKYKYSRAMWFEPFLARLLVERAGPVLDPSKWDAIVPVPLHPLKEREREFNQAARLARQLSTATHIPVGDWLRRVLATRTQTRLSRVERVENIERAFVCCKRAPVKGKRIVLVDDVFTTGATTNGCAGVLCDAGAAEVCVWTVARGI